MATEIARNLDSILSDIKSHDEQAEKAYVSALQHAMAAGDGLIEAKEQVPSQEWQVWLERNFPHWSNRTPQLYMRLAKHREQIEAEQAQRIAPLGIAGANKLISQPKKPEQQDSAESAEHTQVTPEPEERKDDPEQVQREARGEADEPGEPVGPPEKTGDVLDPQNTGSIASQSCL